MGKGKTFKLAAASAFALLALGIMRGGAAAPAREVSPAAAIDQFAQKCVLCHGKDGHGLPSWRAKGQPDFNDAQWQKDHTDAQIADTVRNGKGKYMPSFKGKLSEAEITAVVAKVRSFGKKR